MKIVRKNSKEFSVDHMNASHIKKSQIQVFFLNKDISKSNFKLSEIKVIKESE